MCAGRGVIQGAINRAPTLAASRTSNALVPYLPLSAYGPPAVQGDVDSRFRGNDGECAAGAPVCPNDCFAIVL